MTSIYLKNRTASSLIVQNRKCAKEGFRVKRRIYFLYFLRIVVISNRKMRELFIIVLGSEWGFVEKYFTHAVGWPF